MTKYLGRIKTVRDEGRYGFIDIASITKSDGSPHGLETTEDVFVHRTDMPELYRSAGKVLEVGMEVSFLVEPDPRRRGALRAECPVEETRRSRLAKIARGGIEMRLQGPDGSSAVSHPVMFLTWCLNRELVEQVRERRLNGLAVKFLLITFPVGEGGIAIDREGRELISLTEPTHVAAFSRGGEHRLVALLVCGQTDDALESAFLSRDYGTYRTTVLSNNRTELERDYTRANVFGTGLLEVEIPKQLFAERPQDWAWVNRWFKEKSDDQCILRRRRLFAYTLQPPFFLASFGLWWLEIAFVTLVALLLGMRGLDFAPLRNPFAHNPLDVLEQNRGSIFAVKIKGVMLFPVFLASPLVLVAVAGLAWVTTAYTRFGWLTAAGMHFGAFLIGLGIISGIVALLMWESRGETEAARKHEQMKKTQEEERRQSQKKERQLELSKEFTTVDALVCQGAGPRTFSIEHVPLTWTTMRLHFAVLKRRICRPFARS